MKGTTEILWTVCKGVVGCVRGSVCVRARASIYSCVRLCGYQRLISDPILCLSALPLEASYNEHWAYQLTKQVGY